MTQTPKYTPADLRYAATARCPCGAGLAYPLGVKPFSDAAYWDCSAILTGTADASVTHTDKLPFAFYEVKSEEQPSAGGATTRPEESDTEAIARRYFDTVRQATALAESVEGARAVLDRCAADAAKVIRLINGNEQRALLERVQAACRLSEDPTHAE